MTIKSKSAFAETLSCVPQQPGLRSFLVYDELSDGCIAFEAITDDCDPHLRKGDYAVIDTADHDLTNGELYLVEWQSGPEYSRRQLAMLTSRYGRYGRNGVFEQGRRWYLGGYKRKQLVSLDGRPSGPAVRWADGPYEEKHVTDLIIGKVVGIYEPDFRVHLRRAA